MSQRCASERCYTLTQHSSLTGTVGDRCWVCPAPPRSSGAVRRSGLASPRWSDRHLGNAACCSLAGGNAGCAWHPRRHNASRLRCAAPAAHVLPVRVGIRAVLPALAGLLRPQESRRRGPARPGQTPSQRPVGDDPRQEMLSLLTPRRPACLTDGIGNPPSGSWVVGWLAGVASFRRPQVWSAGSAVTEIPIRTEAA